MFTANEIEEAYATFAALTLWKTRPSRLVCERVARMVNELTTTPGDSPAALFYALGRYPRAFAGAWIDFSEIREHLAALSVEVPSSSS